MTYDSTQGGGSSQNLKWGDSNERVRELQAKLIDTGWWQGAVANGLTNLTPGVNAQWGNFHDATLVVVNFFKDKILPGGNQKEGERGVVGPTTWEALNDPNNTYWKWQERSAQQDKPVFSVLPEAFSVGERLGMLLVEYILRMPMWDYVPMAYTYAQYYFDKIKCLTESKVNWR